MPDKEHVAKVSTLIDATKEEVWAALTDPDTISRYMFGAKVNTDWAEGSPITWEGEWEGQPFQDKGKVREVHAPQILEYSHFSPLSGLPDEPANYHTVRIEVIEDGATTEVILIQNNNETAEARAHSEKNWQMMLDSLKKVVEQETTRHSA